MAYCTILYYTILSHFVLQLLLTFLSYLLNVTFARAFHLLKGINDECPILNFQHTIMPC